MDVSTSDVSASVEGEQGMDIDWLTIDENRLPVRITRSNAACTDTVDFSEGTWNFSRLAHRSAATKIIEDIKPGLIIGGELQQGNLSREDAFANFDDNICHAEYLSALDLQQNSRRLYFLHIALPDRESSSRNFKNEGS